MKKIKGFSGKVVFSGILLVFLSASVFAQQKTANKSAQAGANKNIERIERISAEVSMTPDQKQRAIKLEDSYGQKMKQLRIDSGDDKERFQEGRKKLRAEHEAELRGIMTKEQIVKYDAFLEKEKKEQQAKKEQEPAKASKPVGVDKSGKPAKSSEKMK